jgi:hypothetical protein
MTVIILLKLTLNLSLVFSGLVERMAMPEQYLSQDLMTSRGPKKTVLASFYTAEKIEPGRTK